MFPIRNIHAEHASPRRGVPDQEHRDRSAFEPDPTRRGRRPGHPSAFTAGPARRPMRSRLDGRPLRANPAGRNCVHRRRRHALLASQRLGLTATHRAQQRVERLGRLPLGLRGRLLAPVVLSDTAVGDQVDRRPLSGTREGAVGPLAGELLGTADDDRVLDGRALAGVAGDRVGVLDVVGRIASAIVRRRVDPGWDRDAA